MFNQDVLLKEYKLVISELTLFLITGINNASKLLFCVLKLKLFLFSFIWSGIRMLRSALKNCELDDFRSLNLKTTLLLFKLFIVLRFEFFDKISDG